MPNLVGRVLDARVVQVEEYGVYLEAEGQRILVLVVDISWTPCNPLETFSVGDVVAVRIVREVPEENILKGSTKEV